MNGTGLGFNPNYDTVIIGAGAAGMMCAVHAARPEGPAVLVIDHAKAPGEKIRISGGGRCNFTNLEAAPDRFLSLNPHFCKSALKRYTQWDFIDLVRQYGIPYHEKTLGQLFCDTSAQDIIRMLRDEMEKAGAILRLETSLVEFSKTGSAFSLVLETDGKRIPVSCRNLVVACGGKSIPKMGATGFGYRIAEHFGHAVTETRPGLVPLTFGPVETEEFKSLSGLSCDGALACSGGAYGNARFEEAILFTHRGLSGPAVLQISSYWREGLPVTLSFRPDLDLLTELKRQKRENGKRHVATVLSDHLPKRLTQAIAERAGLTDGNIADISDKVLADLAASIQSREVMPAGSEGYRTAEVTLGGVDTDGMNSKTMESKTVPGLYFIGEVVDVTGWLGGYNFQWAWSSGWAAGTAISSTDG
ncbi:NAD(P)/FAD-dependent oxidoreductase [Hwanghaeella sp.]|uniref:NAD(P)/FAD-dependent oxidoreductase n=1 Tax=Hwanghaeella sp. TaxID=2605943 RepID=UPI003CCC191C